MMGEYREISLSELQPPKTDIRTKQSGEALDELVESIKQHGVLEPLIVRRTPDGYEIVAGYRRAQAARLAGLDLVPCVVTEANDKQADTLKLVENLQREDMNPMDEARCFIEMAEKYGISYEEQARLIGKSKAYISQRVNLLRHAPDLAKDVEEGSLSLSVARELAQIDDLDERKRLAEFAKTGGATAAQAAKWRQTYEASKEVTPTTEYVPSTYKQHVEKMVVKYPCPACSREVNIEDTTILRLCNECYQGLLIALEEQRKEEQPGTGEQG